MSFYWHSKFLQHIPDINKVKYVYEVGARYGDESLILSKVFPNSKITSFECNPLTTEKCKTLLNGNKQITFYDCALGHINGNEDFYFCESHHGISSFLKRTDYEQTQQTTNSPICIRTLNDITKENEIPYIDLLCMDVQGYEINILKGASEFIKNIKFVIMEEPTPIINTKYLPDGVYSKYIDAPSSHDIQTFMTKNNFIEVERIKENEIEDNVMYMNTIFKD